MILVHVSIGKRLKALVEKRERRGLWFYALWLAGYGALASITMGYAVVLGQEYGGLLVALLVPGVVGCAQFRSPTLLGWVVLFSATVLAGVAPVCVFPWLVKGALATGDWWQVLVAVLLLVALGAVLYGLIRYRPPGETGS